MEVTGTEAERIIAYKRGEDLITVVPRWMQSGTLPDASITLPAGSWTNVLTGESQQGGARNAADLLGSFPVALLTRSH